MSGAIQGAFVLRVERGPDVGALIGVRSGTVVGRQDGTITDSSVSRQHARFEVIGGELRCRAVSGSPTTIGEDELIGEAVVAPGSLLRLGTRTEARVLLVGRPQEATQRNVIHATANGSPVARLEFDAQCVIGREPGDGGLALSDPRVSRVHAVVRAGAGGLTVEDAGSSNGTYLRGQRLRPGEAHAVSGPIRVGDVDLTVEGRPQDVATEREIIIRCADGTEHALRIAAGAQATVADVTAAAADGLRLGGQPALWRTSDGLVPHPTWSWSSIEVQRGERWVLEPIGAPGSRSVEQVAAAADVVAVAPHHRPYTRPVNRPPRSIEPPPAVELSPPPVPNEQTWRAQGGLWQIVGGLAGASLMVVAALLVGGGFVIFAAVGAVAAVVGTVATIGAFRARRRQKLGEYGTRLAQFDTLLAATSGRLLEASRESSPSVQRMIEWLDAAAERVWERRPSHQDWARVRVGTGAVPTLVRVPDVDRWQDESNLAALRDVVARHAAWSDAPVVLPGSAGTLVAVRGEAEAVAGLGRSFVVQHAAMHDPGSLAIAVVGLDDGWSWATWLPHVRAGTRSGPMTSTSRDGAQALIRQLRERVASAPPAGAHERRPVDLVVLLGPGCLSVPGAEDLCDELLRSRGIGIVLCGEDGRLPRDPTCLVTVAHGRAAVSSSPVAAGPVESNVEGLTEAEASRASRLLAPLVDQAHVDEARAEPSALRRWLDGEPLDVRDRWLRPGIRPCGIGTADDGTELMVDLRANGPHAVLGGTTGSGKSELIKTLVTALALEHGPHAVTFFLIDFKGGSTFFELDGLPHVTGMVTDLENDRSLAERAFLSLDAEIVRRKAVLERHRAIDIIEYERMGAAEPMPTLVVVIDEFALLKEQFPDLVPRLDTVAKQGRSLGVHLVLGTQDPRQVISSDIRSNTNLWISLRVVLKEQSMEVLGTTDAAMIPAGASGRGFVRYGAADHTLGFQTYWVTRPAETDRHRVVHVHELGGRELAATGPAGGRTVLSTIVDAVRTQSTAENLAAVSPLWQQPLPPTLDGHALDADARPAADRGLTWACGMLDDPGRQVQELLEPDLAQLGHVVAIGAFGSGKSTFLGSAVMGLAARRPSHELHVYAIDAGNGDLGTALRNVPNVAAVVGIDDHERLLRLVRRIRREIEQRRREAEDRGRWQLAEGSPYIVVCIDEFVLLRELSERWVDNELQDVLTLVLQGGPGVGVHVIAATPQIIDMRQAMFAMFGGRVLLRLSDPTEYRTLGAPNLAANAPPGRGWWFEHAAVLVQVAQRTAPPVRPAPTAGSPAPIPAMPATFQLDDALPEVRPAAGLFIGVGGDEVSPVWFDPRLGRPHLLVLGEGRSGRTTALLSIAKASAHFEPQRRIVWFGARPATWPEQTPIESVDTADAQEALGELEGPALVLIDDAEQVTDPAAQGVLAELARSGLRRDIWMVTAGRSSDVLRSYEDWIRQLLSLQTALLLSPTPDVEIALDLRPARVRPPQRPGRGLLARAGEAVTIQVGMPTLQRSAISDDLQSEDVN